MQSKIGGAENVFLQDKRHNIFSWENLGDIRTGRKNLGEQTPVLVYRLMQYTMLDVLTKACGDTQANDLFRQAGFLAGSEFARNVLKLDVDFNTFLADLKDILIELKIGILRMEEYDVVTGKIILTIEEDLDCSGIPVTGETTCYYDEGFIAGILKEYTGLIYDVREIDCWANGDRKCRFLGLATKQFDQN